MYKKILGKKVSDPYISENVKKNFWKNFDNYGKMEVIDYYRLSDNSVICINPNEYPKMNILEYIPNGDGLDYNMYKGIIKIIDEKVELEYKLSYISFIPSCAIEEYQIDKLDYYETIKNKGYDNGKE